MPSDLIEAGNAMAAEIVAHLYGNGWSWHDRLTTEGTIARWRKVVAKTTHRRPVVCHACDGTGFVHDDGTGPYPATMSEPHPTDLRPGHVIKPCHACKRCSCCCHSGVGLGVTWEERP
jgi:hypothetical protein